MLTVVPVTVWFFDIKTEIKSVYRVNTLSNTVQYRPSETKIVFGLKVPSGDGLGLILSLK